MANCWQSINKIQDGTVAKKACGQQNKRTVATNKTVPQQKTGAHKERQDALVRQVVRTVAAIAASSKKKRYK